MHRSLLRTAPLLAAVALTTACAASAPPRSGPPAAGPLCEAGRPVLVVRNEAAYSVQVVARRMGRGSREVLAELGPGRHEVRLPNDRGYTYRVERIGGGAIPVTTTRASLHTRAVSLERECRPT